ncbi:hypothetical protein [Geobacter grbiciae]|uniref:hypothetical protein n=1 Tax=Geobacter grbiciae TaxID=155042 RepID=UPI001C01F940|nr:hypothetical protein [Geobacter grbiciae]MBT1073959.1 hypothetical protein [Geobacter grbiciae]
MNYNDAVKKMAARYGIPQKIIRYLIGCNVFTQTLDRERDLYILEFLGWAWGNNTLLRVQLAALPRVRRSRLAETADLNKWERYVYGRYMNAERIMAVVVAAEIEAIFGVAISDDTMRRIKQIRRKVQNARHYKLKRQITFGGDI